MSSRHAFLGLALAVVLGWLSFHFIGNYQAPDSSSPVLLNITSVSGKNLKFSQRCWHLAVVAVQDSLAGDFDPTLCLTVLALACGLATFLRAFPRANALDRLRGSRRQDCLYRRAHSGLRFFRYLVSEIPLHGTRNATRVHGRGSGKQRKIISQLFS